MNTTGREFANQLGINKNDNDDDDDDNDEN